MPVFEKPSNKAGLSLKFTILIISLLVYYVSPGNELNSNNVPLKLRCFTELKKWINSANANIVLNYENFHTRHALLELLRSFLLNGFFSGFLSFAP